MKKVCMILVLCLLVMLPCCKKKLPTQADTPTKVLPTIEYFHATPEAINSGEVSILSWSVKNATNITINQDVGTVSAKDTVEVSPEETTTYTLTAINSDGQKTQSCTVEVTSINLPIIDYFTATPPSIMAGEDSTLSWCVQSEGLTEALRIEPLGDLTIPYEGSHPVSPTETTTYTLIAVNSDGQTQASCTVEVTEVVLNPPTIESFIAIPESITVGEKSVLSWETTNAMTITIDPGIGVVESDATVEVSPTVTTTYTLIATNDDGEVTASCTIEVTEVILNPPTIEHFTATPESINRGDYSMLSWFVIDATTLIMEKSTEPGSLVVPLVGTQLVSPIETITYTLTATNDDGEAIASCTIEVILNPPIIEYFIANPTSIKLGDKSELSWSVTNADTRRITQNFDPAGLDVGPTGTCLVGPTVTTIFTLTATNDSGQTTSSCEVEIKKWAELELSIIPERLHYYSVEGCTYSDFTVVLTEAVGVGGQINDFLIETGSPLYLETFPGGTFSPFGSFSRYCSWIIPGGPTFLNISIEGVDDNGYMIELDYQFTITWVGDKGIMTLKKNR